MLRIILWINPVGKILTSNGILRCLSSTDLLEMSISIGLRERACCPVCDSKLIFGNDDSVVCTNHDCLKRFPIISGVPILINESESVFSIEDFVEQKERGASELKRRGLLKKFLCRPYRILMSLLLRIGENLKAEFNYSQFRDLLLSNAENAKVLIVGSGDVGKGIDTIINDPAIEFIETDVQLGGRVDAVADAHNIPFFDETFDGLIIQAVLEHVCDPYRCVEEIYRVLKPEGLVYAETPFMQPGHKGRYDFTRFTFLGRRRLFRKFEVIEDGSVCGSGMALALSYRGFLWSLCKSKKTKMLASVIVQLTSFWLKYIDYFIIDQSGTIDAASGFYFLGRESDSVLSDKELIQLYRGNHYVR